MSPRAVPQPLPGVTSAVLHGAGWGPQQNPLPGVVSSALAWRLRCEHTRGRLGCSSALCTEGILILALSTSETGTSRACQKRTPAHEGIQLWQLALEADLADTLEISGEEI